MKIRYLICIFCFSLSIAAQEGFVDVIESNIAIVSADKLNVVYRGILNPISISVPNCKSFTANGLGLNKISEGKYSLTPGSGLFSVIKLDIELNNGSKITEEHKFRIKGINHIFAKINDRSNCEKCILEMTKEELYNSTIKFGLPEDFLFQKGSIFVIDNIGYSFPGSENYLLGRLIPIKIMIVEKEVQENYYESTEFTRDSIRRIKNEKKLFKIK